MATGVDRFEPELEAIFGLPQGEFGGRFQTYQGRDAEGSGVGSVKRA